jgi:hypothetical protein
MSRQVKIIVGAIVVLLVAGLVVWLVTRGEPASAPPAETVRIEVRSMPKMTITKDGKKIGTTPLSFIAKRSAAPIFLEARWTDTYYNAHGSSKTVHKRKTQSVVPDHDITVDFTRTPLGGSASEDDGSATEESARP